MKRLEVKNLHTIEELKREIRETKDWRYSLSKKCIIKRKEKAQKRYKRVY
jgi:hypothetical protein